MAVYATVAPSSSRLTRPQTWPRLAATPRVRTPQAWWTFEGVHYSSLAGDPYAVVDHLQHLPLQNNAAATHTLLAEMGRVYENVTGGGGFLQGDPTALGITTHASFAMWLKLRTATPVSSSDSGWPAQIANSDAASHYPYTDGLIYCGMFRATRFDALSPSTNTQRTNWHHLAVTSRPGTVGWRLFMDGQLIAVNTGDATIPTSSTLYLGRNQTGDSMDGWIADVRFWNTALTDAEVMELARARRWDLYARPLEVQVFSIVTPTGAKRILTRF